jgi:apolipoprotein N-acyltransferase
MQLNRISWFRIFAAICFVIAAYLAFPPITLFFTVTWPFFVATGLLCWVLDGVISKKPKTP